jgi:hypothetical protein
MRALLRSTLPLLAVGFALAASPPPRPAKPSVLPFVHDDYPKALAEARARKLPLFVDSWAPW